MTMMELAITVTGLNLVILTVLFSLYLSSYRKIRANFTMGLLIFTGIFMVQKLVSLYLLVTMMYLDSLLGMPMFILEVLEALSFSVLLWLTLS